MADVALTTDPARTKATGGDVIGRRVAESTAVAPPATARSGVQLTLATTR